MAKNKIERIDQEIAKTREKIAEQQEKLKDLEAQKTEAENLEIVQMVRALRMTPAQPVSYTHLDVYKRQAMCMMLVMLPFFMLAMYEKHGQPQEEIIGNILKAVSYTHLDV